MQGYSDSAFETVAARSADHASVTAQNGEAGSLESGRRSGAAQRLNMDDVVMTRAVS